MPAPKTSSRSNSPNTEKHTHGTEPMYFAFLVWGAVLTTILYFWGHTYITFYNRELGVEMGDYSNYEVLLFAFNVIKIIPVQIWAVIILGLSLVFTLLWNLRQAKAFFGKLFAMTRNTISFLLIPAAALLAAGFLLSFFKGTFELCRRAASIEAMYVKSHLDEKNGVIFIFEPGAYKLFPAWVKEANDHGQFHLIARTKQSYFVMRKLPNSFDPLVYEIPMSKVNMTVIGK